MPIIPFQGRKKLVYTSIGVVFNVYFHSCEHQKALIEYVDSFAQGSVQDFRKIIWFSDIFGISGYFQDFRRLSELVGNLQGFQTFSKQIGISGDFRNFRDFRRRRLNELVLTDGKHGWFKPAATEHGVQVGS